MASLTASYGMHGSFRHGRGGMIIRAIQAATLASVFVLLLTLAAMIWDGPSALIQTATEWAAEESLPSSFAGELSNPRTVPSGTCNDDAALFATCEAPVAQAALLMPGERVKLLVRFNDFKGEYAYHCHNLEHADGGMMRTLRVE